MTRSRQSTSFLHSDASLPRLRSPTLLRNLSQILISSWVTHLKVRQSYQDHSHVVKSSSQQSVLNYVLDSKSRLLVETTCVDVVDTVPDTLTHFKVAQLVENTITCEDNKVFIIGKITYLNFWYCYYNIWVAA